MRRLTFASIIAASLVTAPGTFASPSDLTLAPRVIPLGMVAVGTTAEETVTLRNTGEEALTLNGYEAFGYNGNFSVNPGTCTLGTAPGESCSFSIVTSPSVVGAIRGQFCFIGVGETTFDRKCGRVVGGAT